MNSIAICNTASDNLSIVNVDDYSVKNIPLDLGESPVGPHGIDYKENTIITANSYSNSISIVDLNLQKEVNNLYVGSHPNDIKLYKDKAYIACGDSNSLVVMDMKSKNIFFSIELESYPHNIEINKDEGILYISNMDGHSVSILDCLSNKIIGRIESPEYPTKILLSKDKEQIYLCESYLGYDTVGDINIISTKNYESIGKVKVGHTPVDICEDGGKLYVSNFTDQSISVVDINELKEIEKIYVGGMPRGIAKKKDRLYIGDYIGGNLKIVDFNNKKVKTIPIGTEPNGMILIN